MKYDNDQPCKTCPYRKDAKLGVWHPDMFIKLLRHDASEYGALYECHQTGALPSEERQMCIGWLLDQKKRGLPSITLRMHLHGSTGAQDLIDRCTSGGHRLYSLKAMCKANLDVCVRRRKKKAMPRAPRGIPLR